MDDQDLESSKVQQAVWLSSFYWKSFGGVLDVFGELKHSIIPNNSKKSQLKRERNSNLFQYVILPFSSVNERQSSHLLPFHLTSVDWASIVCYMFSRWRRWWMEI